MCKNLLLCEASAGSGKTFKIVSYYLHLVLKKRSSFKTIAAITFTNKAVYELKSRILEALVDLAEKPSQSKYLAGLLEDNSTNTKEISDRAHNTLLKILHNYDYFTVSTIDSFFKQVVYAFGHEINLFGNYNIELSSTRALDAVVDTLMQGRNQDKGTTMMLLKEFALRRAFSGASWNVQASLKNLLKEIFSGFYRLKIADSVASTRPEHIIDLKTLISEKCKSYEDKLKVGAERFMDLCAQNGLTQDHFPYQRFYKLFAELKETTAPVHLAKMLENKSFQMLLEDPKHNVLKSSYKECFERIAVSLREIVEVTRRNCCFLLSYCAMAETIYIYSLFAASEEILQQYRDDNSIIFISDITFLLNKLISNYMVDIIYEKVGTRYKHYLIDEFQDTSEYQWLNLKPLVQEAISHTDASCLVVGDQKQSIYRWREGNPEHNLKDLKATFGRQVVMEELGSNYRSFRNIILFNNALFTLLSRSNALPARIQDKVGKVYKHVQQNAVLEGEGSVSIEFLESSDNAEFWEESVRRTIQAVEQLQDIGKRGGDIALLVRNKQQAEVLGSALIEAAKNNTEYNYNFVSEDSLQLGSFKIIKLIINVFKLIIEPQNALYFTAILIGLKHKFTISSKGEINYQLLPEALRDILANPVEQSLYTLSQRVVAALELGCEAANGSVLEVFQNLVINFELNNNNNILEFIEYWDQIGKLHKIQFAEEEDSIKILTIHKAKGLEFNCVIVPFCNWPIDENISQSNATILWADIPNDLQPPGLILPVPYKKYLRHSLFAENYRHEELQSVLDSLNLLYVAFTRGVECLKVLCPLPAKTSKVPKINTLLFDSITGDGENGTTLGALRHYYDKDKRCFELTGSKYIHEEEGRRFNVAAQQNEEGKGTAGSA